MSVRHGSILIIVLWCLFFLSALAVAIYSHIAPQIGLAQRLKERAQVYYWAKAGVKEAMYSLDLDEAKDYDALNELWANNEKMFKNVRLSENGYTSVKYEYVKESGESETRYGLVDESSRINLNKATQEILQRLMESAAVITSAEAGVIADSILDWIDEDADPRSNGAETGYYESLAEGYSCPNQNFQSLEELFLIKGMTQEIFDKVKGYLTVYTDGKTNFNTAGKYVLEAFGMSDTLAEKVLRYRQGNDAVDGTSDDNIFVSTQTIASTLNSGAGLSAEEMVELNNALATQLVCARSDYFRGESLGELRYDEDASSLTRLKISFVFDRDKHIRYWHEE